MNHWIDLVQQEKRARVWFEISTFSQLKSAACSILGIKETSQFSLCYETRDKKIHIISDDESLDRFLEASRHDKLEICVVRKGKQEEKQEKSRCKDLNQDLKEYKKGKTDKEDKEEDKEKSQQKKEGEEEKKVLEACSGKLSQKKGSLQEDQRLGALLVQLACIKEYLDQNNTQSLNGMAYHLKQIELMAKNAYRMRFPVYEKMDPVSVLVQHVTAFTKEWFAFRAPDPEMSALQAQMSYIFQEMIRTLTLKLDKAVTTLQQQSQGIPVLFRKHTYAWERKEVTAVMMADDVPVAFQFSDNVMTTAPKFHRMKQWEWIPIIESEQQTHRILHALDQCHCQQLVK